MERKRRICLWKEGCENTGRRQIWVYKSVCMWVWKEWIRDGRPGELTLCQSQQKACKCTHVAHMFYCILYVCMCLCIQYAPTYQTLHNSDCILVKALIFLGQTHIFKEEWKEKNIVKIQSSFVGAKHFWKVFHSSFMSIFSSIQISEKM